MKYEKTPAFDADWRRLSRAEREMFLACRDAFVAGADDFVATGRARRRGSLRVKRMTAAPGVWEMTWSFAGPDGRATFEFVTIDAETGVRWRRIGGHHIFDRP